MAGSIVFGARASTFCSGTKVDARRQAHVEALRLLDNRELLQDQSAESSSSSSSLLSSPSSGASESLQSRDACRLASPASSASDSRVVKAFSRIYAQEEWGVEARSGLGSREDTTREFRSFLESFLRDRHIQSVVDAGCGHWPTGYQRFMNWHQVHYYGLDAVSYVVGENKTYFSNFEHLQAHGLSSAEFQVGQLSECLPAADLLLVKDVLMHLPTSVIHAFLDNNIRQSSGSPRYKAVLLVENEVPFNLRQFMDIEPGQLLPFDISKPPFHAPFVPIFRWRSDEAKVVQVWES